MRGALKLFTWLGIPVFLHWTFGLIFVYILWHAQSNDMSTMDTLWLTGLFMALFVCVLLHEYGHALAARRYGVKTRDIVLMPIGGVARLERMPEKPGQEFVVAIAGPLVNVIIALLLVLGIMLFVDPVQLEAIKAALTQEAGDEVFQESGIQISHTLQFVINLAATNIALVLFNMIPAFPMDGGRVFRALLSMRLPRAKATRIAAWLGQAIALLMIAYGLWNDGFMLAILGLFVIYAARSENDMVQTEDLLGKFKAKDLLRPNFTKVRSNDWMLSVIELLRHGLERHFLVFDLNENLVGVLEEEEIIKAMRKPNVTSEVSNFMHRPEVVHIDDSLMKVHHLIRQQGYGIIGVVDENGLVGVIDEMGLVNFVRTSA
jgi:Zn-dependent protease/predicted transcriptional regulator